MKLFWPWRCDGRKSWKWTRKTYLLGSGLVCKTEEESDDDSGETCPRTLREGSVAACKLQEDGATAANSIAHTSSRGRLDDFSGRAIAEQFQNLCRGCGRCIKREDWDRSSYKRRFFFERVLLALIWILKLSLYVFGRPLSCCLLRWRSLRRCWRRDWAVKFRRLVGTRFQRCVLLTNLTPYNNLSRGGPMRNFRHYSDDFINKFRAKGKYTVYLKV